MHVKKLFDFLLVAPSLIGGSYCTQYCNFQPGKGQKLELHIHICSQHFYDVSSQHRVKRIK